jgi:hypothetical protein
MTFLPQKSDRTHSSVSMRDDVVVRWAEMQVILLARSAIS